jgi:hypothetical protein
VIRHIFDVAKGSGIPHVLIGEMSAIWRAVNCSDLVSRIELVMQRLYDPELVPEKKKDHEDFVAILKREDGFLKPCANLSLISHYSAIMARVKGDPYRLVDWIVDGLCEAGRKGVEKLEWKHLEDTGPRLEQTNDAARALDAYSKYRQSIAFRFPSGSEDLVLEATDAKEAKAEGNNLKPFEPKPRHDLYPEVA